jgi:MinD-like ATPase involved in chromosome partitioning or flagellar assembly
MNCQHTEAFLGEIPFDQQMVVEGDAGSPTVLARPESASALALSAVAQNVAEALGWKQVASSNA